MKRSTNVQILTTHIGSLPQPPELNRRLMARAAGEPVDSDALDHDVRNAVVDVLRRQVEAGITVANDGEQGKSSWAAYVQDRINGLSGPDVPRPRAKDAVNFPDHYATVTMGAAGARPACDGPLSWKDFSAVETDIANLKAALQDVDVPEVFMSSSSPGNVSNFHPNRYYPSEEEYLHAIADVMQREYEAIVNAGFLLQLDCPDLAIQGMYFPEATNEEFRKIVAMRIEALNYATRNIPPESMRVHVCWGRNEPARVSDQPLKNLVHEFLKARAMGLTIVGSNGRHEYEWQVWKEVKLPDDKVLIPGVIDNTTSIIEHPETVAERIQRYASVVGKENLIAGVNCGFGNTLLPGIADVRIVWAKLKSLADGAALAAQR